MKKFLLGGIFTLIGIFNITSAYDFNNAYSFSCYLGTPIDGYIECNDDILYLPEREEGNYEYLFTVNTTNGLTFNSANFITFNGGTTETTINSSSSFVFSCNTDNCSSINIYNYEGISGNGLVTYNFSSNIGGNEGGNEGGSEGGGIIEGGINAFSGIIERLGNIFGEFGPYIIYIAIACLGISLLFKALKYILGFTNNSAKNSIGGRAGMRERRRRRRKMRRYKRTENEARKYYYDNNYDRDEAGNGKLYRRSRKNSEYLKKYRNKR